MGAVASIALTDPAARDPSGVGVKAAGLAAATDAGLPVLPGRILPLEASASAIAGGAAVLDRTGPSGAYLRAIEAPVPVDLQRSPTFPERSGSERSGPEGPGEELFVVRSSTAHDGDGRWSGAFASYLGIGAEDLPTAVRGCWASAFSGDALARCGEMAVPVGALRVGVLVQPFVRFDAGGVARLRHDGVVEVSVSADGAAGLVGGRRGGQDLIVGIDGLVVGEQADGAIAATATSAAALARRAADTVDARAIEWGAVGGDVFLLQIGPAGAAEAPPPRARRRSGASEAEVPADAARLARLVTTFAGPLAEDLVLPWAFGAEPSELAPADEPLPTDDPAVAVIEARTLADAASAAAWGTWSTVARERAAAVSRLLLEGRIQEGLRTIARLPSPDPAAARRVIALIRAAGASLAHGGLLPSAALVWRLTGRELDRAIAGASPTLRRGPGRWEPFVADVVGALGRGSPAIGVAPGIGAGRLRPIRELRSIGRPGPREVLLAPSPLPHLAPLLWHCAGLVTTGGTAGAHLFEVARSLGLPAVIAGALGSDAEAGSLVAVDGDAGTVSILVAGATNDAARGAGDHAGVRV